LAQKQYFSLDITEEGNNFQFIYNDPLLHQEFLKFLTNVFHLYPEEQLHKLIIKTIEKNKQDQDIYINTQTALGGIQPFLSDLTYALPALNKQKKIITEQTLTLLGEKKRYEGYLELGSTGRYIDALEEAIEIQEGRYFVSEKPAIYSLSDMLDRGQISKAGQTIELNDYQINLSKHIPKNSLELVTVYIGFHHCPIHLREEFITTIRDTMKTGASLVVRDHDVHDKKMYHMAALAHDVFNMGTQETWSYNNKELRNFYSLEYLDKMLKKYGFKSNDRKLYQQGDPTLNALMIYTKT
jgi:hypothetical protein